MENENDGICENGKSYLINPNLLFGQGIGDNIMVPSEDLNIYVELTTSKKNRSIIDFTPTDVEYTSSDVGKKRVSFIDGSPNGKDTKDKDGNIIIGKSLTTSYTELTTIFNKTADTEKFGITSIDIDFNSAYAPLVHIEFVDIRGASLFNTGNPPNSEYSGFFDLPYPIFQLKVKGFYGKTVKYCLHLTKWNARFNTITGNFEISADFIGYTYAMLSDMLLGYLRAITYTRRGASLFNEAKAEMKNPAELITIKELLDKFVDVNEAITKLQNNDSDITELSKNREISDALDGIEKLLNSGIDDIKNTNASQSNAIFDSGDGLICIKNFSNNQQIDLALLKLETWRTAMKSQVAQLNNNITPTAQFNIDEFASVDNPKYWKDFKYNDIIIGNSSSNQLQYEFRKKWLLTLDSKFIDFTSRISGLEEQYKNVNLTIYDFSNTIKKINEIREQVKKNEEETKIAVAIKIRETFIDLLGFEPTIGSIFRIFTVHAEIFLACLKEVSEKAETSSLRMTELLGLRKDLDVHPSTSTPEGNLPPKIYPWPLFRVPSKVANKNNTLEEAYLGTKPNGVKIPQNVPELVFVEELLEALIKVAKEDIERQDRINNPNVIIDSWYPINVLDTPLFGVLENPYKTNEIGNTSNPLDPLKLMLMRAFVFLGISNRNPNEPEIRVMGTLEANTCYEGIINPIIKKGLFDVNKETSQIVNEIITWFKNGKNDTNTNITFKLGDEKIVYDKPRPLFIEDISRGRYVYTFLSEEASATDFLGKELRETAITFNDDFDGSNFFENNIVPTRLSNSETLNKSYLKNEDGLIFTEPNYFYQKTNNLSETGAIFMKIFDENTYGEDTKGLQPNYIDQTDVLNQLKGILTAGGATEYLDACGLYNVDRNKGLDPQGFNILGDAYSRFAFTTIKYVDITNFIECEVDEDSSKRLPMIPTSNDEPIMPLKALFYTNQSTIWGATSLASTTSNIKGALENGTHKGKGTFTNNIDYYDTQYPNTDARSLYFSEQAKNISIDWKERVFKWQQLGLNRDLFNNENVYVPFVDFAVSNREGVNDYTAYSLFGSQWYFEQRRSSSPKAARAFLFLHTFPWNQLYTDDVDLVGGLGINASIFDNAESYTISNLFDRKSAFLNVPYLWAAFIGGILWRYNENEIIWENDPDGGDPSGKVPTFEGGSGKYDPIIWGAPFDTTPKSDIDPRECYLSDFEYAYRDGRIYRDTFPRRDQYFTDFTADAPLQLNTDGEHKIISRTLLHLPIQIRKEFRRIFFDFVNSQDWKNIRANYELHPKEWDLPNIGTSPVYNTIGTEGFHSFGPNSFDLFSDGTKKWKDAWENAATLKTGGDIPTPNDGLEWGSTAYIANGEPNFDEGTIGIKKDIIESFPNWKNYEFLQPIRRWGVYFNFPDAIAAVDPKKDLDLVYNWDMSFKDNSSNKVLVELFKRGVWVANVSYKSWQSEDAEDYTRFKSANISTPNAAFELYISSFVDEWKRLINTDNENLELDNIKQELFNTMDNDLIRLNIYRHCKAIYDKWVAGSQGDVMTSCGQENKSIDKALATLKRNTPKPRLIDSFRFVNRGFNDLSDTYLLNPSAINEIMTGNLNQSFYDLISRVLADNNFNFIALPAFIDFKSDKVEMKALFKPEIFSEPLDENVSGPTFVCVYVGQSSNKLDLGNGSDFPNDGFDFKCDVDTTGKETNQLVGGKENTLPFDFINQKLPHEHNVIAFAVNYGQQNQNIFTDIKLDQQEFAETDESLQITDSIANNGSQSSRTQAGQNLWNVYQVRSYSAEVTAMGNAMIQPMMYFQLNNIPMFHGGYLITSAKHKIEPNYMTTTFKGTRTRYVDTAQFDSDSLYMSMLGTLSDVDGYSLNINNNIDGSGSGSNSSSFEPIVTTLIENGVNNGYIELGQKYDYITTKKVDVGGIPFGGKDDSYMITEASNALTKMLKEWTNWMGVNGFKKDSNGKYGYISSLYRNYNNQAGLAKGQKTAAKAGTSYHGWGLAVDMSWVNKEGKELIFNYKQGSSPNDFDYVYNPAIEWLYNNSYRFGFINPSWARDGSGYDEAWHWEYHGTSAKCLLNKNPNVYGKKFDTTKEYDIIVKNPKTTKGIEAVYGNCDKKYIKIISDGIEQKDTNLTDPERMENQLITKNFFKNKGYNKEQTAGIMGNIQQESKFNPLAINKKDLNGYPSLGLIQWNGKFTPKGGSKDYDVVFNVVGRTVTEQLNYLIGMPRFEKFSKLNDTKKDVGTATYQFANLVEVCDKCNQGLEVYVNSYQNVRTEYAKDFLNRFNDSKDKLFW